MLMRLRAENPYKEMSAAITLGQKTEDQTEWTIGRSDQCDITIDELEVSRNHASIKLVDGEWIFIDHSSNGSVVNGVPFASGNPYTLNQGDRLGIGNTILTIEELKQFRPAAGSVVTHDVQYWTEQELTLQCFRVVEETPDTKTFFFVGTPPVLFHYLPGQFVNLEFDIDGKKVVRPYSISSSPSSPYALSITVKRVPDGVVSNWMNSHLKVGDIVKVMPGGAKGKFTCLPHVPSKLLFLAAGSGVTPLMSMLRWIYDTGTEQITDVVLIYSVKSARDIIFRKELELMAARMAHFRVIFTLTAPQPGESWAGFTGRISDAMIKLTVPDLMERSVFVCGSTGFMKGTKSLLQSLQFPVETQYQQESFGGKPASAKIAAPEQQNGNGNGHTHKPGIVEAPPQSQEPVTTLHSGSNGKSISPNSNGHSLPTEETTSSPPKESKPVVTATATPMVVFGEQQIESDETSTILELSEMAGVSIPSGCGAGVCSTCKVRVLTGQVKHEPEEPSDVTLSPQDRAAGYVLACIAHPVGHVEIELRNNDD